MACCGGIGTAIGGFDQNLTCQTAICGTFFLRAFRSNISLPPFSNIASDHIPHVFHDFYCTNRKIRFFEHDKQKMVRHRCQTLYRTIALPRQSQWNLKLFLDFLSDKIFLSRNHFFYNRVSSRRDTHLQRRQVETCFWAPKSSYLLYGTTSRKPAGGRGLIYM